MEVYKYTLEVGIKPLTQTKGDRPKLPSNNTIVETMDVWALLL